MITCTTALLCVLLALLDTRQAVCEGGIPVRYQTGTFFGKRQVTNEDVLRRIDGPYGRNLMDLLKAGVYLYSQMEDADQVERNVRYEK